MNDICTYNRSLNDPIANGEYDDITFEYDITLATKHWDEQDLLSKISAISFGKPTIYSVEKNDDETEVSFYMDYDLELDNEDMAKYFPNYNLVEITSREIEG